MCMERCCALQYISSEYDGCSTSAGDVNQENLHKETMHFTAYTLLLLTLTWPVSSMSLYCHNMRMQTENILNSLQTIRNESEGTTKGEIILKKHTENKSVLNAEQMCELAQKLTNYQVCDLELSPDIKKKMNYTKIETKGLVDNIEMNLKNLGCVLSPPVCPSSASNTSLWNKIHALLDAWSLDVIAYSYTLKCAS